MNNLKIKARLLLCFLGIVLMASIPSITGLNRIRTIDSNYSDILENYGFAQGDIGRAIIAISEVNAHTHDAVSYEDEDDIKAAKDAREEELSLYEENIKIAEKSFGDGVGKEEYDKAVSLVEEYIAVNEELIEYSEKLDTTDTGDYIEIEHKIVEELDPAYTVAYDALNELLELKKTTGDKESEAITKNNNTTYVGILIVCIIVLISAIVIGILASNSIASAIKKCVKRIHQLADGDLKSEVPSVKGKDELADLSKSLSVLVTNLNRIIEDEKYVLGKMSEGDMTVRTRCDESYVGDFEEIILSIRKIRNGLSQMLLEVDEAAEQVGIGSEQVASGAQELAQGATEQASAVEQLNATIDGIAKEIKANAEQAMDMSNLAINTEKEIEEGNRQMSEMTVAMTEISNTSNKIAKIIKTIDDIAFQTNILALNAAVEAARAGAAGKGFAVVADEVRNLAGKSAEAAKNTTELIESSIKAVANGTEIADRTADTLSNVVLSAQKTANIVNQMAHSTEEQAKSVEEITKGIEQISAVVQTNSATSEESAAASEELSCQSNKMRELIGAFVLEKNYKNSANKSAMKFDMSKPKKKKTQTKIQEFTMEETKVARLEDVQEINLDDFEMDNSLGSKY